VVNNCSNDTELRADLTTMQSSGDGTLTFNCGTATISMVTQLPDIKTTTTVDGAGKITLSGLSATRIFVLTDSGKLTLKMIDIALEVTPISLCEAGDRNHNGVITIDDLVAAVHNALHGCG
jgi:hypothetical protein